MRLNLIRDISLVVALLFLSACGGGGKGDADEGLSNTYAFESNGPYANVLAACIQADSDSELCSLNRLPILGLDNENLSIPMIMDRLVVSHQWMGTRFEYVLYNLPPEMLNLFKGVTAVVIDDDIRPAYYTSNTGAIYLDPDFIWLTNAEKDTINKKEDFRAGFADPLAFRSPWRYVNDGDWVSSVGSLRDNSERALDDIIPIIASLLLHELAHANDFIPPSSYELIDRQNTVRQASGNVAHLQPSNILTRETPLESSTMYALGAVMFRGEPASNDIRAISATQVGETFETDGAADDYAYSSRFEDTATLFEEAMMNYLFGIDRDIAFTSAPGEEDTCDQYIVKWGVRNRIGNSNVKARAQFVLNQLLPNLDLTMYFQDLPPPTDLRKEVDWCVSINLEGTPIALQKRSISSKQIMNHPGLIPYH